MLLKLSHLSFELKQSVGQFGIRFLKTRDILFDRVRQSDLIERILRFIINKSSHDASGNTDDRRSRRNFFKYNAAGAYLAVIAYLKTSEYFSSGGYHDIVADSGMSFALFLTGTAEGNTLIQCHVIADLCRLADDYSGTVIDKQSLAYGGSGMDLDTRLMSRSL